MIIIIIITIIIMIIIIISSSMLLLSWNLRIHARGGEGGGCSSPEPDPCPPV